MAGYYQPGPQLSDDEGSDDDGDENDDDEEDMAKLLREGADDDEEEEEGEEAPKAVPLPVKDVKVTFILLHLIFRFISL